MARAATATRNGVRAVSGRGGRPASGPGASRSHAARPVPAAVESLPHPTTRPRPRQSQVAEAAGGSHSPPANDSYDEDHPHCMKVIRDAEEEIRQLQEALDECRRQEDAVPQLQEDKARLTAQVGRLRAQVQELRGQLSTATANAQSRAQQNIQPLLQELYSDASSMMNKVCSRMDVSQFDKCMAEPSAGNIALAEPNGQFAMNNYSVAPADPFPAGVDDLADFRLYPTDS